MGWRVTSGRQQRESEAMADAAGHRKFHVTMNGEERALLNQISDGGSAGSLYEAFGPTALPIGSKSTARPGMAAG